MLAALGVSVTAMELPTAISGIGGGRPDHRGEASDLHVAPLLGMYNVIFVLPPIALLADTSPGKRLAETHATRQRLQKGAQGTMLWVAGLVGGGFS